jgi:hypothetical protein
VRGSGEGGSVSSRAMNGIEPQRHGGTEMREKMDVGETGKEERERGEEVATDGARMSTDKR